MIEVGLRVVGLQPTVVRMRTLEAAAEDLQPALERMAERFRQHLERVFETEGAATQSGRWAPLSDGYARWKARFFGGKILQRTRRMRDSLVNKNSPYHVERMNRRTLTFGSDMRDEHGRNLVALHQKGGGKLPARKIIDPPETLRREWVGDLRAHLARAAEGRTNG